MQCNHKCIGKCYECKYGHINCLEPCERKLNCGHKCLNRCWEVCTKNCMEMIEVKLPCNHYKYIKCHEQYNLHLIKCYTECEMVLLCNHRVVYDCYEEGNDSLYECKHPCNKTLQCGHICKGTCFKCKYRHIKCKEIKYEALPCGHNREYECNYDGDGIALLIGVYFIVFIFLGF